MKVETPSPGQIWSMGENPFPAPGLLLLPSVGPDRKKVYLFVLLLVCSSSIFLPPQAKTLWVILSYSHLSHFIH